MFKHNTYIVLHTGKELKACNSEETIEKFCRAKYTSEKRLKDKFLSRRRSGEGTIHRKKKGRKEESPLGPCKSALPLGVGLFFNLHACLFLPLFPLLLPLSHREAIKLSSRSIHVSLLTLWLFHPLSLSPSPSFSLLTCLTLASTVRTCSSLSIFQRISLVLVRVVSRGFGPYLLPQFPITVKVQFIPRLIDWLHRNPFPFSSLSFFPCSRPPSPQAKRNGASPREGV